MQHIVRPRSGKQARGSAERSKAAIKTNGAALVVDVELDPERDVEAEREALARLAACDFGLFVERVKADAGFIFESDALKALIKLGEKSRADFARLRAKLEKDAKFRRFAAVEGAMRAEAGTNEASGDGLPGRPITFEQIEPCDEPVDGEEVLTGLSKTIGAYVIMSAHQRDAAALWAVHAHAHDLRDTSPPLVVKSPAMRSGKTKLVEMLERLVPRPLFISGITVSFLERAIEAHRPTLLIDEYDALTGGDPALAEAARAQLNRSAKRRGARVGKSVPLPGGGYESRLFSTWAPTVIAGIGDPPSTVRDRAVVIDLKRKLSSEKVKPLRERDGADLAILRARIARFVNDNEQRLRADAPVALDVDNDRAKDMWEPLLAIADIAGGEWPQRAREAGLALAVASETETADADVRLVLLGDIRDIFATAFPTGHVGHQAVREGRPDDGPRLASKRLLDALHGLEERLWSAWGRAKKPLTGKALSDLLKPYGVRSNDVRIDGAAAVKGYYLRTFEEVFTRYLPRSGISSSQGPTNLGKQGESEVFQRSDKPSLSDDAKVPKTPANPGFVGPWEDEKGGVRGKASIYPDPAQSSGPLLSQERVEAAEGAGVEFHLEEPTGFTWIYAVGVNPADPNLKLAEAAVMADRAGVEEFLRWRRTRWGQKP